jgi:hypothetical protein
MENENFDLSLSDFLRTPSESSQSDCSQPSRFDFQNYNPFELTPSDYQTSLSTLSDNTIYSSSDSRSYDREPETSIYRNPEYGYHDHNTWTTSTEPDYNGNAFFPSYQLSTDTPFSTQDHSREYSPNSSQSIYHTANTHFSSSQESRNPGDYNDYNSFSQGIVRSSTLAAFESSSYGINYHDTLPSFQQGDDHYGETSDYNNKTLEGQNSFNHYD